MLSDGTGFRGRFALGLVWRSLGVGRRVDGKNQGGSESARCAENVATRQGRTLDRDREGLNAPKEAPLSPAR